MKRPFVILTGASGAGKSTLIRAAVEANPSQIIRLRSVTTRPPRDPASDASYDFVTRAKFKELLDTGQLAEHDDYNPERPHFYGTAWSEFERVGAGQVGLKDMTEPGLKQLLATDRYRIHHVLIEPINHTIRSPDRIAADEARAKLVPAPAYRIPNDHSLPHNEGFDRALAALMNLLHAFAASSH